jgi:Leucine-rich repeat (LRR) protein
MGRHLVITVHGIRTFGGWQERLEALLSQDAASRGTTVQVVHYKYGYFSAFAFLSVFLRWFTVRRFRTELRALVAQRWDRIDIVAHSFGTFVVAKALQSMARRGDCPRIHTLILAGSVLPSRFRWSTLVPRCVHRVVNECGTRDQILLLSQALPLLGMAGRVGFEGMTSAALRNRFFILGHSGYFLDSGAPSGFMERRWVPLLMDPAGGDEVATVDERHPDWKSGIEAFVLNNASPLKIGAYLGLAAALIFGAGPYMARQFAQRAVTREKGYVATENGETKLWFDRDATPNATIRRMKDLGPLHVVDFAATKLDDAQLAAIPASTTLRVLDLSYTAVTSASLGALSRFPNLEELHLDSTKVGDLSRLPSNLRRLKTLDLDTTGIDDEDLVALAPLAALEDLDLSWNQIRGPGLVHLAGLSRLRTLALVDNRLEDEGLRHLAGLAALRDLDLEANPIGGKGLVHFASLRALEELDLSFTQLDDEGLARLPALPKLRSVTFTSDTKLTGATLAVLEQMPSLEELWMKDTHVVTGSTVHIGSLRNLKVLALPATRIGRGALVPIGKLEYLKELYLGAVEITDEDLDDVAGLNALELLYLPGNPQLTDRALLPLARMGKLRDLNLERTSTTVAGRERLRQSRPGVEITF